MSYSLLLQLARCRTLNRCLFERCLKEFKPRFYCINNDDAYTGKQELKRQRRAKRKEIRARLIRDFQQTKQKVEQIIERENIWTVPNFLCVGRILTTPCISYLIVCQDYQVLCLYVLSFSKDFHSLAARLLEKNLDLRLLSGFLDLRVLPT